MNSKCTRITDVNVKCKTNIFLVKKNRLKSSRSRKRQRVLRLGNKMECIKRKIDEWDIIKIKNVCCVKDFVKAMKRKSIHWENIFANYISTTYLKKS